MDVELSGTKRALVLAAGELFAEQGVGNTSVRTIAEQAGANIAAINYHFGSKENLYREALEFVLSHCESPLVWRLLEQTEWLETPVSQAETICALIKERSRMYLSQDLPSWYGRLIIRTMIEPTQVAEEVMRKRFVAEEHALTKTVSTAKAGVIGTRGQDMVVVDGGNDSDLYFWRGSDTPVVR